MGFDMPAAWWDDLGDDELLARLTNHPDVPDETAQAVALSEEAVAAGEQRYEEIVALAHYWKAVAGGETPPFPG